MKKKRDIDVDTRHSETVFGFISVLLIFPNGTTDTLNRGSLCVVSYRARQLNWPVAHMFPLCLESSCSVVLKVCLRSTSCTSLLTVTCAVCYQSYGDFSY